MPKSPSALRQRVNEIRAVNSSRNHAGYGTTRGYYLTGQYPQADRKRQVDDQFGYPEIVTPWMLYNMYERNAIANSVVTLLPRKCWQEDPIIYDGDCDPKRRKENPTEFEKTIDEYAKRWGLWAALAGVDERQRVMRYGGLIIECTEPEKRQSREPLTNVDGPEAIIRLKPVYETQIEINEADQDELSPNYGNPRYFNYRTSVPGSRNIWDQNQRIIDPSRVIVWAEGADDGSVYGQPVLTKCYNAILDLNKTRGAFAEGGFKNSKQRIALTLDGKDTQGLSPDQAAALSREIDREAQEFNATLALGGMVATPISSPLANPEPIWWMAMHECAAAAEAPATMIIGQQTGRLASDQDNSVLAQNAESRNKRFTGPAIVATLQRLVDIGALPEPDEGIEVDWPSLQEPSQKDRIEVVEKMAMVNERQFKAGAGTLFNDELMIETAGFDIADAMSDELDDPDEGEA